MPSRNVEYYSVMTSILHINCSRLIVNVMTSIPHKNYSRLIVKN